MECLYLSQAKCGEMMFFHSFHRDMYEGTRMASEEDLSGIRKIIRPLEESGVLVRRTDKEVTLLYYLVNLELWKF